MTVTNNLTNITLAETADGGNWDDLGGGAGSAQSSDLPIQGAETRARRIDNKTIGFGFDNGVGINISATGTHVGFWLNVLQPGQIGATQGLELSMSDSGTSSQAGNWDGHHFQAADYPSVGGWQRVWVNVARTRDAGSGTLGKTSVRGYGCQFEMGDVGGNAANCHMDRIDYGTNGLTITGGSVGTPTTFADAISVDASNAYGIINANFFDGRVTIGGAATEFEDKNFSFKGGNQPLADAGWVLLEFDASVASANMRLLSGAISGIGVLCTGTAGTINLGTITIGNNAGFTLNTAVTWAGKAAACGAITAGGASLANTIYEESTGTSALIWNTAENLNTKLAGATFISSGTKHGLELATNSPTAITLSNVNFSGYASSNGSTGNEAIYVRRTSGTVDITIDGGTANPSIRTAGATVNLISGATLTISNVPASGILTIYNNDDSPDDLNELGTTAQTTNPTTGANVAYSHSGVADDIWIQFLKAGFEEVNINFNLSSSNQSLDLSQFIIPEVNL